MRMWLLVVAILLAGCAEPQEPEEDRGGSGGEEFELDFWPLILQALLVGVVLALVGYVVYLLLRGVKEG